MSTYIAAKFFIDTINNPNTQSIMVAQDETNAKRIFKMILRFYEQLSNEKRAAARASTISSQEITWKHIDSSFFVGWAGSTKLGRGGTINNIHLSEPAFYENLGDLFSGLLQSVPPEGNIFLESTANGVDNLFYKEYKDAEQGLSIYTPRFYPWFLDPNYASLELFRGGHFIADPDEQQLAEQFDLSDEQLIWRRNKILELRNAQISGDESAGTFVQEYPSNPDEAFLTTGVSYFDNTQLKKEYIPKCSPPLNIEIPKSFPILRNINGRGINYIRLWKRPVGTKQYIISADTAEGLNLEGDHDYCSSSIFDFETWEQVGTIHGRWEPRDYAEILNEAGRWFNDALLIIESNNHGHAVITNLLNELGYPRMRGCSGLYEFHDWANKKKVAQLGYPKNQKTKKDSLAALTQVISEETAQINDKTYIDEMILFTKLPGGKFGCTIGHDDRVTDLALIAVVLTDSKFTRKVQQLTTKQVQRVISSARRRGVFV